MAYNEQLADRIEQILVEKELEFKLKKMFGGACFMVDEKMCVGIIKDDLMARIDPDFYPEALEMEGVNEMKFANRPRPMKGYVLIEESFIATKKDLDLWVQKCLEFNPFAKKSKKKKKS